MAFTDFICNSTTKILKAHNKTILRLEKLAVKKEDAATKIDAAIEKLMNLRDAHLTESNKAAQTAAKFKQLAD